MRGVRTVLQRSGKRVFALSAPRRFVESLSADALLEWVSRSDQLRTFLAGIRPHSKASAAAAGPGSGSGAPAAASVTRVDLALKRPDIYAYDVHIRFRGAPEAASSGATLSLSQAGLSSERDARQPQVASSATARAASAPCAAEGAAAESDSDSESDADVEKGDADVGSRRQ